MSVSLALTLSLIYIVILVGATIYNQAKSRTDLFISSAFVLVMYVISHLGTSLWLMTLPLEKVLGVHYLFLAVIQATIAAGLFYINRKKLRVIMSITILFLVIEALLDYAVHIDRNVIALNGALVPNAAGSAKWMLWNMIDIVSQINSVTVLLAVTLGHIYQVKTDKPEEAYAIQEKVEAYLDKFGPSRSVSKVRAFLKVSGQNLCFYDGASKQENQDAVQVGLLLLNESIKECCYEPDRTKPVGMFGRVVYWLRS